MCVSPVNCTAWSNRRQARNTSMWQSKPEESRSSCVETNGIITVSLIKKCTVEEAQKEAQRGARCQTFIQMRASICDKDESAWQEGQTDQLCRRMKKSAKAAVYTKRLTWREFQKAQMCWRKGWAVIEMILLWPHNQHVFILPAEIHILKANFDKEMQDKAALCCRNGVLVFIYLLFHPSTVS